MVSFFAIELRNILPSSEIFKNIEESEIFHQFNKCNTSCVKYVLSSFYTEHFMFHKLCLEVVPYGVEFGESKPKHTWFNDSE